MLMRAVTKASSCHTLLLYIWSTGEVFVKTTAEGSLILFTSMVWHVVVMTAYYRGYYCLVSKFTNGCKLQ